MDDDEELVCDDSDYLETLKPGEPLPDPAKHLGYQLLGCTGVLIAATLVVALYWR